MSLRNLILFLLIFLASGCGNVNWFPDYVRQPTTPDQFSFPTKTGVAVNSSVTSDAITVAGLTAENSPISVSGPNNSEYSINGGAATATAGTVKNGDKVTVTHTSASTAGQSVTSTLTIGGVSATFTSITQTVSTPSWSSPVQVGGLFLQVFATITSADTGTAHLISIRDSANSGNATFSITPSGGTPVTFATTQSTAFLNGQVIWVRNTAANVSAGVKTTLTIDGVDYDVPL